MEEVRADQLKRVIEAQHGGTGKFVRSVRVMDSREQAMWDGLVHVFELADNPKAKRAYAWSSGVSGSAATKRRYFAVLHQGKVTGPVEAVKAAALAINTWGPGAKK